MAICDLPYKSASAYGDEPDCFIPQFLIISQIYSLFYKFCAKIIQNISPIKKISKKSQKNLARLKNNLYFCTVETDRRLPLRQFQRHLRWDLAHGWQGNGADITNNTVIDSVAQLVEQLTLNQWVEGSSPSGVTKGSIRPMKTSENR